jgi:hypothetical protein
MPDKSPPLNTPQGVITKVCSILSEKTLQSGEKGVITIQSHIPKNGLICGSIDGWESVPFQFQCSAVQGSTSLLIADSSWTDDALKVFSTVEEELIIAWQKAAKAPDRLTISSQLIVRSEYERGRERFRVFIEKNVCQRLFVQSSSTDQ